MVNKILFIVLLSWISVSFSAQAQIKLYPLSQYSVGQEFHHSASNSKISAIQNKIDTLTIPFIEDFSGAMVPIKKITVVVAKISDSLGRNKANTADSVYKYKVDKYAYKTDSLGRNKANTLDSVYRVKHIDSVYRIQHLKMHGLDPKVYTPIRIFNVSFRYARLGTSDNDSIVKVIGKKYAKVIDKYTIEIFNDSLCTIPVPTFDQQKRMFFCNWLRDPTPRYSNYPDTLAFLNNDGGVFINDDMAPNAISSGVATFDGVKYNGFPYSTTQVNGYADNLTSLPFYLGSFTNTDSIGLSFYWQSNSLGLPPQTNNFLALEFKTATGTWNQVWKKNGNPNDPEEEFRHAFIPIIDPMYLYDGFQYRFLNYGLLSGRYNVWNVDYIYINKKMSSATAAVNDVSFSSVNKNCLQNYTSIPYEHFKSLSDPNSQLKPTSKIRIRNGLPNTIGGGTGIVTFTFTMATTDNIIDTLDIVSQPLNLFASIPIVDTSFTTFIAQDSIKAPYILRQNFYSTNADTIYPIDMSFNNFRRNETVFYDYYAYDDGTPEDAALLKQAGGLRFRTKYEILKNDILTHLDYCFLKNYGPDLTNLVAYMTVWKVQDGDTVEIVENGQPIYLKYSADINGFVRYEFSPHMPLAPGTYFFGLRQEFDLPLFIGYDRNNDRLDKSSISTDGKKWTPLSNFVDKPGALMIRPVFYKQNDSTIVTSVEPTDPKESKEHFTMYPNPAENLVTFAGNPDYVILYDISGRILLQQSITADASGIQIDNLPNGIYVVALKKNDYTEIKRLIVQK